jgi:hypothetical protein
MKLRPLFVLLALAGLILGCSSVTVEELTAVEPIIIEEDPDGDGDPDRIIIVDQTGKEWNITHAVKFYNMRPDLWQYGLGPRAIRPINDPKFVLPGQRGYPRANDMNVVVATSIGGDSRAYRLDHLNSHEVCNDSFGDVHVAVGW